LGKNKHVKNYNMKTVKSENNTFSYTYQLVKGISDIKGGIKVLKELNYPVSITDKI
jgi:DNA mismatch repair ATPase MutS